VHVSAVDAAGNHSSFDALPFVRATSTLRTKRATQSTSPALPMSPAPPFLVGAGLTDPTQPAAGLRLARVAVPWPTGATGVDPTTAASLQQLGPSVSAVIELTATALPVDDTGRFVLALFAASVAAQVQSLGAIVLAPAPTGGTGANYDAALAAIRSELPDTPLGLALDGSTAPTAAVAALAGAEVEFVAFRPAPAAGKGLWTLASLPQVQTAFPDARIIIDGAPAPFAGTITTAACTPGVTGVLLDQFADVTRPALQSTIRAAERGAVICPGVSFDALPFGVQFPVDGTAPGPIPVSINCNRDCLYLVTLDRTDGRPVVAARGQFVGGADGQFPVVRLPRAKVPPGTYRVDVRLVSRVNPGAVTRYVGPPLALS
jgi:hypothetical protein